VARSFLQRRHWLVVTMYVLTDALLVNLAFLLAYWVRYGLKLGGTVTEASQLPISVYYPLMAATTAAVLLAFTWKGLYRLPRGSSWLDAMSIIVSGSLTALAVVIILALAFVQANLYSRLIYLYTWLAIMLLFGLARWLVLLLRRYLWQRGIDVRQVLVVGAGRAGQHIMKDVVERPEHGYKLVGYVEDNPADKFWTTPIDRRCATDIVYLGNLDAIARAVDSNQVEEVIIALPAEQHSKIVEVIEHCRRNGLAFKLVPDLFEMSFNQVQINGINGVPLVGVKEVSLSGFNLLLKRGMDITVTMLVLIPGLPLMLLTALLIKLTSRGPIILAQDRVGKNGRVFKCYKFRSMYQDAEARRAALLAHSDRKGIAFKMKNDPRKTPVGAVIRKLSVDELPQLFNILKGEMSLVGPRPPIIAEVEKYDDWARQRLNITPGLTGLWQVSGRSDLSFEEMVKLDLYYAENWSLGLDLKIILRTIPALLTARGAY
jgi:exopolysaccharide biosynthesis polyprenyl glycosylphosphotransferase